MQLHCNERHFFFLAFVESASVVFFLLYNFVSVLGIFKLHCLEASGLFVLFTGFFGVVKLLIRLSVQLSCSLMQISCLRVESAN
jgi:TctA family transporter